MGIWTDAFIAPPKPVLLRPEAFGSLAVELARERVARTPWALLAGKLRVNASLIPQHRPLSADHCGNPGGPTHPVRTCVVHTFKHSMAEGPVPALASVASRCFGPDMISGDTWG
ncbi:hypothetical protein [Streptomyces sp. NPDC102437]|uniref:hypothetical protein n=1 Tax=Streptomyces sp. NPDC102437 TaxID=3366175 RepID=UPI003821E2EB